MRRLPLSLCVVGVAALAGAALAQLSSTRASIPPAVDAAPSASASVRPATSAARSVAMPRIAWRPGERLVFAIDWRSSNAVKLGDTRSMALDLEIAGELSITVLAGSGGAQMLAVRFARIDRARVTLDGRALYPDDRAAAADLLGKRAVVELADDGGMRRLALDADPSGLFRHVMRAALVELDIVAPTATADAEWSAAQRGPSGLARVDYRVVDDDTLLRRRGAYDVIEIVPPRVASDETAPREQRLDSHAVIRADGSLRSLVDQETLAVVDDGVTIAKTQSRFALDRLRIETATAEPAPLASAWQDIGEARASEGLSRRLLAQRVDGLSIARMRTDVLLFAGSGLVVEQSRWVWRASGLLLEQAEACDELASLFESPALDTAARGLVLDLLASAGHARAQAAMRRALQSKALDDEAAIDLVQRFSFLAAPEDATIDAVLAKHDDARARNENALASATIYTLGALLGNLRARHAATPHPRAHALLRSSLATSGAKGSRRAALAALGNAGFPDDAQAIRAHAADDDEQVRSQVAWSLRKLDGAATRATLLALADDPLSAVQTSALRVLAQLALGDDDLARLAELASGRRLTKAAALPLVDLLGAYAARAPARAGLEAMRQREDLDPQARSRARALLTGDDASTPQ